MSTFVNVAIPLGVRKTFVYSVPARLENKVFCGGRVLVPFGRRVLTGFVVSSSQEPPDGKFKVRPIRDLVDPDPVIPPSLVGTALWVADYYYTPPGEILKAMLPPGTTISVSKKISLAPRAEKLLVGGLRLGHLCPQENVLIESLAREGPMSLRKLATSSGLGNLSRWVESLSARGWIRVEDALEKPRVAVRKRLGIRLLDAQGESLDNLTPKQRDLYFSLAPTRDLIPLQEVLRSRGSTSGVVRTLEKRGVVEIAPMELSRLPLDLAEFEDFQSHTLTEAQQRIFHELRRALLDKTPKRYLLHGVTGSGKTEIYLRLIAEALKLQQGALLLVPEIGLTPLLSRIAVSHFPEQVSLLHSGMSAGERFDQWNRIRSGRTPVVVGTRSAIFAPIEGLRLIVIDEEQDPSYKQDETPYYHAREVAWDRIQRSSGILVMGSATPSVETYHAARVTGEIGYLSLPERIQARPLPDVIAVDMSLEFQRHGKRTVISQALHQELEDRLRRGEQSIVLLNRRGYSRALLCRSCGHIFTCPECSVPMTYHELEGHLICHYCALEKDTPSACGNCGGKYIYFVGVGTEQLEEILRSLFPKARLARVDRDTTRRRGSLRKILLEFVRGNLDILVGTQMLAKGHDFPNVTLVGVVGADAALSFPDFRSAERTFQLLTQVAGRAGRGQVPGKVVLQSFHPDHYALKFAKKQDYAGFYQHEIEFRKLMGYPPLTHLVQILIKDATPLKALQLGNKIAKVAKMHIARSELGSRIRVLGPAAAPLERLRGKYRYQLLIKSAAGCDAVSVLRNVFEELGVQRVSLKSISVDVDPLTLL